MKVECWLYGMLETKATVDVDEGNAHIAPDEFVNDNCNTTMSGSAFVCTDKTPEGKVWHVKVSPIFGFVTMFTELISIEDMNKILDEARKAGARVLMQQPKKGEGS